MTNLDSMLKSRDITLPTKVHLLKSMVFPVVMYGCESWTIKKAEHQRIDAFELWCWRRLFFLNFIIIIIFYFTILYWFCHTSTCICHGCTHVAEHHMPPNLVIFKDYIHILSVFYIYIHIQPNTVFT